MKNIIIIIAIMLFASITDLAQSNVLKSDDVSQPFDLYTSNITWTEQKNHLNNFTTYLQRNPETFGCVYINFEGSDFSKAKPIVDRIVKYLVKVRKLEIKRFALISVGGSKNPSIKLQPIDKINGCNSLQIH